MRDWDEPADTQTRIAWPEGWAPDVERFRSGIDLSSDELLPGELDLIRDWYRSTYGDVPAHVEFLGATAPDVLKTYRARYETTVRGALPAQMIPLLALHLYAVTLAPKPVRRAVQLARALGVSRREVVTVLLWAAVYGGDAALETAFEAVDLTMFTELK